MYPDCYTVALPYPECTLVRPDPRLLRRVYPLYIGELHAMLSELDAAQATADSPALAQVYDDIAEVDLRHFRLLGGLIRALGGEPMLRLRHESPMRASASMRLHRMAQVKASASDTYRALCAETTDAAVRELLERLAMDEDAHAQALSALCR